MGSETAKPEEESVEHPGCDFCKRPSPEYLRLETPCEILYLCSWTCVIASAAVKAHDAEAHLMSRLRQTEDDLDRSEKFLALLQAGCL